MIVKLLTEHHLKFLSLKGGCRGSSKSTLVKLLEISFRGSLLLLIFLVEVIRIVVSVGFERYQTDVDFLYRYQN